MNLVFPKLKLFQKSEDWRLLRPHQNLISYFLVPRQIHKLYSFQKWTSPLKEPVEKAIHRLIVSELIVSTNVVNSLVASLTGEELRKYLKSFNLSTSGNKVAMATRLADQAPGETKKLLRDCRVYVCSEKGAVIANAYKEYETQRLDDARKNSAKAIREQRWSDAEEIKNNYNRDCVFPRGFSINNLTTQDANRDDSTKEIWYSTGVEVLRYIVDRTPKVAIINGWDKLPDVRLIAAMFYLWGNAIEAGINCDEKHQYAARALISHAYFLAQIELFKNIRIKNVRFLNANDQSVCQNCKKAAENIYSIENVPELPYENCTESTGCRCTVTSVRML